ncbi:MAG: TonB family protein [Candidatus Omnitrophica bacterium]|nr:TonB family protein [Candidatus Omnitrophota bacterium]MDD5552686.1 TonB family protein [Candidatus Omnitrophota bacterium]
MRNKLLSFLIILALSWSSAFAQNTISLDLKGMDIVDALKILASRAGMNIVVGKNVSGKVTLFLKDVDVREALEIILLSNDLACEEKTGIISVMTQREYELIYGRRYQEKKSTKGIQLKYAKAADVSKALSQIKSNVGKIVTDEASNTVFLVDSTEKIAEMEEVIKNLDLPLETRFFALNYAQADKLNAKIQDVLSKGAGTMKIDERTNKIAVTDYPRKLDEITAIINAFDEKTLQVLIDAQVIEIKPSDKFEMGIDWDYWIKNHFRVSSALPVGTTGRLLVGTDNTTPASPGDYKAVVDLLRTIGDIKILSSPRIMALNNQEAKIHVGTKDAYITSTTSQGGTGTAITSQSVNFVDTGIKLFVTPTVNRDGFVTMKIRPEVSSATRTNITSEGQITQIPIVSTSEAETTIMIKDGVTVIIGGLKKNERSREEKRVPILGSIPVLGWLFGSTVDDARSTDLVILLTPHIVSAERPFSDFRDLKTEDSITAEMVKGEIIIEGPAGNPEEEEPGFRKLSDYRGLIAERISTLAAFEDDRGQKGKVELSFALNADGSLSGEPVVVSSTNKALDDISLRSVKKASPFPYLPEGKEKENFRVSLLYK